MIDIKKILVIFLLLSCLFCYPSYVFGMANGEPKTYRGSGDDQSITDIFKDYGEGEYTKPETNKMQEYVPGIQSFTGTIISVIIIIIYGFLAVTTAIDLAYIAVPSLRTVLYTQSSSQGGNAQSGAMPNGQSQNQGQNQSNNTCLISTELRSLVNIRGSQSDLLKMYFKKRVGAIIAIVIVTILLLQSSIFTDFGFNIGSYILRLASEWLGF